MRQIDHQAAGAAFHALRTGQAERALLATAGQAIDASRRPAFEAINGEQPRAIKARPSFTADDLRDQIAEAQRLLSLAQNALWFGREDMDDARRFMDDATDALAEG